jgi:4-diphosphocytidyl-2-C-methyl-D-erythritol kinase
MPTLTAPAKLNLFLSVGDVRPDGYHAVTTVLVALDAGDEVSVEPSDSLSLVCEPDVGVPPERNLAWRAAEAMASSFGREPAFAIRIAKRTPAGAGLGGGSSDAAAVIACMAAAWGVDLDDVRLETVARSLGADVAFFLRGGCGVYAGRGDVLRRSLPVPAAHFAVVFPGVPVATAAAYVAFDALGRQPRPAVKDVTDAICQRDVSALGAAVFNNMTPAAVGLAPMIADAIELIAGAPGCAGAAMAGSGSAAFGVFADAHAAGAAADAAAARGWWSLAAAPAAAGTLEAAMGASPEAEEIRRRHLAKRRR